MDPVNINMPGYGINEYMLVISPPEDLWQKINRVKEEFAEQYKAPVARFIKPHIALVNFLTWNMMEEKILQRLQTIAMGMVPFKIELKDYGSYPSHTIIINVTSKLPIKNLVSELKAAQRIMKLNQENKPHFLDEPHITVAHKLKPWQYEQGWEAFSHRHFTGRFIADSMLLLKRRSGEKGFQIAKRFDFMNLPVSTKQGSLFV